MDICYIGDAAAHVLEPHFVSDLVGHMHDGRAAACGRDYPVSELFDRDLVRSSDVENVARGSVVVEQPDQRVYDITDVAEAPCLRTVPVNGERFAGNRLAHEAWDNHPVRRALARSYGVEEPDDDRGQISLAVVSVGKDLVDGLRRRVRPPGHRR